MEKRVRAQPAFAGKTRKKKRRIFENPARFIPM